MLGSPGGGQGGGHRVLWPPSTVHPQPAHQQPAHDGKNFLILKKVFRYERSTAKIFKIG